MNFRTDIFFKSAKRIITVFFRTNNMNQTCFSRIEDLLENSQLEFQRFTHTISITYSLCLKSDFRRTCLSTLVSFPSNHTLSSRASHRFKRQITLTYIYAKGLRFVKKWDFPPLFWQNHDSFLLSISTKHFKLMHVNVWTFCWFLLNHVFMLSKPDFLIFSKWTDTFLTHSYSRQTKSILFIKQENWSKMKI